MRNASLNEAADCKSTLFIVTDALRNIRHNGGGLIDEGVPDVLKPVIGANTGSKIARKAVNGVYKNTFEEISERILKTVHRNAKTPSPIFNQRTNSDKSSYHIFVPFGTSPPA